MQGDRNKGRGGIWGCLPCLTPCFARRKDSPVDEVSAHSKPVHHQHNTGTQARGNPHYNQKARGDHDRHVHHDSRTLGTGSRDIDAVRLDFGDCDSDAHLQRGWGDGVLGGKTITVQSSLAYPDDEGEDSDGTHFPGAKCEM